MFRNYYEFRVAMDKKESVWSIMEALGIRKFGELVTDELDILVTFKANKKELNKVLTAINKYGIGEAKLV